LPDKTNYAFTERKYVVTLMFVVSLFMLWGIAIAMGNVLNSHFQHVLHISKSKSALIQLSLYGAYAVMGIPAGLFMKRFGYKHGVLLGLLLYACGAFLFIPAANVSSFAFFRFALFILACGLATLETVAHPFVASLGSPHTSAQRLNFAQGFNGLGGIIGPFLGGYFILKAGQEHSNDLYSVKVLYTVIGCVILGIACFFFFLKVPALNNDAENPFTADERETKPRSLKGLFKHRHFLWSILAQFCNVAAQGGTWAFFIIYGVEVMKLPAEKAAYYFVLSMFLKTIGRFSGAFLLRYIAPNKMLAISAITCITMCLIITQAFGWTSFIALIMLNFFFSVMYPTIYSLGLRDMGEYKQQASSFIVMGVAGGAVFPTIMGRIADFDVAKSYYLPIICYAVILLFALKLYKTKTPSTN
jgi:FHS family L-fucose permease-like MFS transporter